MELSPPDVQFVFCCFEALSTLTLTLIGIKGFAFNKTVTKVQYANHHVQDSAVCHVTTADGSKYSASYCITTFSSGVMNAAVASKKLFHPPLPVWKADAFAKAN